MFVDGNKFIYKSDSDFGSKLDGQILTFKRYNRHSSSLLCYYEATSDMEQLKSECCIPIINNENPEDWL